MTTELSTAVSPAAPQAFTLASLGDNPIEAVEKIGGWYFASGMFGLTKPAQGCVVALACLTRGEDPFKVMGENMIVEGRLTRKYDVMLADLRKAGGDYEWLADGENGKVATLRIKWKGREATYSYTMEAATKAGVVKAGSAWEKRPGNMLRSKAVRNGLQMHVPEIAAGYLTPEDAEELAAAAASNGQATTTVRTPDEIAARAAELKATASEPGDAIDATVEPAATTKGKAKARKRNKTDTVPEVTAEFEAAMAQSEPLRMAPAATVTTGSMYDEPAPVETATPQPAAPAEVPDDAVRAARKALNPILSEVLELGGKMGMTADKVKDQICKKFGVASPYDMTVEQANVMLTKIREKAVEKGVSPN